MTNHVDRFYAATSVLANHGYIKQRLIKAFEEHLEEIDGDDLPVAMKQEFADLRHEMHRRVPSNSEGRICASVRKMSAQEAGRYAVAIVSLYREMLRHSDNSKAPLPVETEERRPVPPFLVKSG